MIPIPPPKALKRAQGLCLRLNFLSLRKEQGLVGHGRLGGIFIEACCRTKEQRIEEVCDKVCEIAGAIDYMDRNISKYCTLHKVTLHLHGRPISLTWRNVWKKGLNVYSSGSQLKTPLIAFFSTLVLLHFNHPTWALLNKPT